MSKNNFKERVRKMEPKKERFSIRKFTVGAASVLLGFTFFAVGGQKAQAAEQNPALPDKGDQESEKAVASDQDQSAAAKTVSDTQSANKVNDVSASIDQLKAQGGKKNDVRLQAAKIQNQIDSMTNDEKAALAQKQGVKDEATTVKPETATEADPTKLETQTLTVATEKDTNKADLAKQVAASAIEKKSEVKAQDVSTWDQLASAINDTNIGQINLTQDITINGKVSGASQPNPLVNPGKIVFDGKGIARQLTINGNSHTLDFGKTNKDSSYYFSFTNNNQNSVKNNAWDLTFQNINLNASGYPKGTYAGAFAPIYFGEVSAKNEANSKVTFENVNADVKNGPLVSGSTHEQTTGVAAKSDKLPVYFKGNNTINNEHVQTGNGNALYDYGSTIDADSVTVLDGTTTINTGTLKTNNDTNAGGNAIRVNKRDGVGLLVQEGATLNINGLSADVRGIVSNDSSNGTIEIDGNFNANMKNGHSSAITAGNLTIGKHGSVKIITAQDNEAEGTENSWANQNTNYNGTHYAPITLGVGAAMNQIPAKSNTLTDNGSLTIIRNSSNATMTPLISIGAGLGTGAKYRLNVGDGAVLDLQDNSSAKKNGLLGNTGSYTNSPKSALITMWGSSSDDQINFNNNPAYVNLQRLSKNVVGTLVRLEGSTNQITFTGKKGDGTRIAQWDEQNMSSAPSFFAYVQAMQNHNNTGDFSISGFGTSQGPALSDAKHASLYDALQKKNATLTFGTKEKQFVDQNKFENHFNWWDAQRITLGEEKDVYQPSYDHETMKQTDTKTSNVHYVEDAQNNINLRQPTDATYTVGQLPAGFTATTDKNGNVTINTNNAKAGMYNLPLTVTYTGDDSQDDVSIPVYVTDGNHSVTWGDNGAVEVVTDGSKLSGHETSETSQVLNPANAITSINKWAKQADGSYKESGSIDPKNVTATWNGEAPSTIVTTPSNSETLTGSININLGNTADDVLGSAAKTMTTETMNIPVNGATAKSQTSPVHVYSGSTTLTGEQFSSLIDNHIPADQIAKVTWKTAPKKGDTSATVVITFKDNDKNGQPTHLDITLPAGSINVTDKQNDADKYTPTYNPVVGQPGDSVPSPVTVVDENGKTTTFPTGTTVSSTDPNAHFDENGNLTYNIPSDATTSIINVPVDVKYPDGSHDKTTATVVVAKGQNITDPEKHPQVNPGDTIVNPGNLPKGTTITWSNGSTDPIPMPDKPTPTQVVVTLPGENGKPGSSTTVTVIIGNPNHNNEHDEFYGQQGVTFIMNDFDTHKTSSENKTQVAVPSVATIVFKNYDKKWNVVNSVTYKRNDTTGKYEMTNHTGDLDKITVGNYHKAPQSFGVNEVKTAWEKGYEPNSDVANFNKKNKPGYGTETSTVAQQMGDPNGQQRTDFKEDPTLAGNSKARVHISLDGTAAADFFGSDHGWCNTFGNYYGAKTGAALTFKQGQDISNLTQDQYRQLIDVTDLGKSGWNGQNINPNAPEVLAYLPGTDNSKQFSMIWAPDGMPSTAEIKNGVAGIVRIAFNDGTYLDVKANINVVADPDKGKPDDQKSEFTQKIVYLYDGKEVALTTIDNIKKGSNLTAEQLKAAIDGNVPAEYQIDMNSFAYPSTITNITKTPAVIYVPLTLKSGEQDKFDVQGQLVYENIDSHKVVAHGPQIKSHVGDTLTAAYLKDLADQAKPANVDIVKYPASMAITKDMKDKGFQVIVYVKDSTKTVNPGDKDATDDMFSNPTRHIIVENPDGSKHPTDQVVSFQRSKTVDLFTGKTISHGNWELKSGSKTQWDEFVTPSIKGYTPSQASVAAQSVTADTKDQTITITYKKNGSTPVPYNPTDDRMNKDVTRTIITTLPNGKKSSQDQTVHFSREDKDGNAGYQDPVTGKITWNAWHVKGETTSTGSWAAQGIDQYKGYTSKVDGKAATTVEAKTVTAETANETVYVTYDKQGSTPVPYNPTDDRMNKDVTRTIITTLPNGKKSSQDQTVHFSREDKDGNAGYQDPVTGKITWNAWHVKGETTSTGSWEAQGIDQYKGYTSKVDGKAATTVEAKTVTAETPNETVYVTYDKQGSTPVPYNPGKTGVNDDMNHYTTRTIVTTLPDGTKSSQEQTVHFSREDKDGNAGYKDPATGKISWNAWHVAGDLNQTSGKWNAESINQIKGYTSKVDGKSATSVEAKTVTAKTANETVYVTYDKQGSIPVPYIPGKPGVNDDMNHYSTRTIITTLPDGTKSETKQTVHFSREDKDHNAGYQDPATGKITWNAWHVAGDLNQTSGKWDAESINQINGYKSQVDGKDATSVAEQDGITAETADITVNVTYVSTGNSNQPSQPTQPTNASQPTTAPVQPETPSQPTTPTTPETPSTPDDNNNDVAPVKPQTPDDNNNGDNGDNGNGNENTGVGNGENGNGNNSGHENVAPKATSVVVKNTDNVNHAAKGEKKLPQTGDEKSEMGIFGLALAGMASLLGLAGDRKRNK